MFKVGDTVVKLLGRVTVLGGLENSCQAEISPAETIVLQEIEVP